MRDVAVIGVGMTKFGKFLDTSLKGLARQAIEPALDSAGIDKSAIKVAIIGNATAGLITGQEMIRGQVVLRDLGIGGIPVVNTENACASSSTAFHLAWLYVASGMYDVALAVGVEKLYHKDKQRSFEAIGSAVDVDLMYGESGDGTMAVGEGAGQRRTIFMDYYAGVARNHMEKYGTTREQIARVAEKNHFHGSMNPRAQYREVYTLEDVLNAPLIADPLTRPMCSPVGDGAAAVIVTAADKARQFTSKPVFVRASVLVSGADRSDDEPSITERGVHLAYEKAAIGPEDLNVLEVHDAAAPAEIVIYEELGLCPPGDGGRLVDAKHTWLGGPQPVNPSGGLLSKGHPIGATGVAQICEIFWQLRGEAGERQVPGATVGLTENAGGVIADEAAALTIHVLST